MCAGAKGTEIIKIILNFDIFRSNILFIQNNIVPLHPVWNKLQKEKKIVDRNVEGLSNYRKEGTDRLQCVSLKASHKA